MDTQSLGKIFGGLSWTSETRATGKDDCDTETKTYDESGTLVETCLESDCE
ncbi:hypothetical protein [Aquimarina agarilytica]|uniref:hypothetical protein n=1 Tax=Aquimarina agarilytica TaxID=1087449 RepID=UPI0012FCF2F8|nr:hypothetical protein [Aquimarina agarilytica]